MGWVQAYFLNGIKHWNERVEPVSPYQQTRLKWLFMFCPVSSCLSGLYLAVGKLADISFNLTWIFFVISLLQKSEEVIFLISLGIFHLPWQIVAEISFNCCADAAKYRSKVRWCFEENKAWNSSKFIRITFAQYCIVTLRASLPCHVTRFTDILAR